MSQRRITIGPASFGLVTLAGSLLALCGCMVLPYVSAEPLAYTRLAGPYRHTQLKTSTTLDALSAFDVPDYRLDPNAAGPQLVNQSAAMVAVSGRSTDGFKTWVTLIAFDEHQMTARRKYFFCVDEQAITAPTARGQRLIPPRKGLIFDAELVLSPEIQTTPYATEEARQLAIVHWLMERFAEDVRSLVGTSGESTQANELISLSGMMMNQVFDGLRIELDKSPGLARSLTGRKGVAFPHINMNEGRLRLTTASGVTTATLRVNLPM